MLSPKRTKFRKKQRGRMHGLATSNNRISFGDFGLIALERAWITNRQIEAARIAMTRHIKRDGKVWIRIFPDVPYTKKPAETRMGKGKGNPEYWVAVVKPGTVMFEIGGVEKELAHSAIRLAGSKLPIRTKFKARRVLL
ncbi:50S ribosomal protein L16 [subsurface metagenome]